jgi:hypothetical protein
MLKREAKKNKRSLSKEIIYRLEQTLYQEGYRWGKISDRYNLINQKYSRRK